MSVLNKTTLKRGGENRFHLSPKVAWVRLSGLFYHHSHLEMCGQKQIHMLGLLGDVSGLKQMEGSVSDCWGPSSDLNSFVSVTILISLILQTYV